MDVDTYIEQHWGKKDVWKHLEWPKHQARLRECASHLEGVRFADIGCAFGHSTEIMSRFHAGHWLGIDFSPFAIDRARLAFPHLRFELVKRISYLSALKRFQLDCVVCSEVIEHVTEDQLLVDRLIEITNKVIVLTTPKVSVNDPGHLRCYSKDKLSELFKNVWHEIYPFDNVFWFVIARPGLENKKEPPQCLTPTSTPADCSPQEVSGQQASGGCEAEKLV